jgi:hypothetical protein
MSDELASLVEAVQKGVLATRLGTGAGHLAKFWREGVRCGSGWQATCACGPGETPFCRAKAKWVGLLVELHDGKYPYDLTGSEPFFMVEAMTLQMVKASGLTVLVEVPGARKPIKFGGPVETWNLLPELAAMDMDDWPGVLEAVVLAQEKL